MHCVGNANIIKFCEVLTTIGGMKRLFSSLIFTLRSSRCYIPPILLFLLRSKKQSKKKKYAARIVGVFFRLAAGGGVSSLLISDSGG